MGSPFSRVIAALLGLKPHEVWLVEGARRAMMDFFRRRNRDALGDRDVLKKLLTKYVSADEAEKFSAGGDPDRPRLEERTGAFFVVNARERSPSEVDVLHARIEAALPENVISWQTMMPLLRVGTVGLIGDAAPSPVAPMVSRLMAAMSDDVRVVYGQVTCAVGIYGGGARLGHGAIIPGFNSILRELLELPFGSSKEVFPGRTQPPQAQQRPCATPPDPY